MPTYQYACTEETCGHRFEAVQAFTDSALSECPVCAGKLRKVFSPVGVVFKGSGFYRNDSRSASNGSNGSKSSSSSSAESGSKSDSSDSSSSSSKDSGSKDSGSKDSGSKDSSSSKSDSSSSSSSAPAKAVAS